MSIVTHIALEAAKLAVIPVNAAISAVSGKVDKRFQSKSDKELAKAKSVQTKEGNTYVVIQYLRKEKKNNNFLETYKYIYYYRVLSVTGELLYDIQVSHYDLLIESLGGDYKEKIVCRYGIGRRKKYYFAYKRKEYLQIKSDDVSVMNFGKNKRVEFSENKDVESIRRYIIDAIIPEMINIDAGSYCSGN